MSKEKIKWLKVPQGHDYPAAEEYLTLLYSTAEARDLTKSLKTAETSYFHAKDIFRASRLKELGKKNKHVKKDIKKIKKKESLSPILLVRDKIQGRVIIADGYHRLCAVYLFDEDARIPCKMV